MPKPQKPPNLKRGIEWSSEFELCSFPVKRLRRRVNNARIARACRSKDCKLREWALWVIREQVNRGEPAIYFDLAAKLITDRSNTCRWQAAIVLGEFIPNRPVDLWNIIEEFGQSRDADTRACIACVLLEHFLPVHRSYRSKAKRLAARSPRFADTLASCWDFADPQPLQQNE